LAWFAVLALAAAARGEDVSPRVWQVARPTAEVPGGPRHGDVSMRSLGRHPTGPDDSRDTFRAAGEFHLTRLEWCGNIDRDFVATAKAMGLTVGASLGSDVPDANRSKLVGRVTGEDGRLKTHPWMPPGRWVGCANSPEYREAWLDRAGKFVDAGVDLIQQDDPHMAVRCTSLCYCGHCRRAFAAYRRRHGDDADYEQFQKDSVVAFHREMHRRLDDHAGRHVPFSHNNLIGFRQALDWTTPAFDFVDAEIDRKHVHPATLHRMVASVGGAMPLVFQFRDTSVANNRRTMAALYAVGAIMLQPWDIYLPGGAPRYFGEPREYADLSGFIRASARFLDGYEDAAVAGPGLVESRYGARPPVAIAGGSGEAFAFARARPGEPGAPVVIHLVEWAEAPASFTVRLRTACFGDTLRLVASRAPTAYRPEVHRRARESGDFSALADETSLTTAIDGEFTTVTVPALHPWGLLILTPASR
jgi:hypothetical protein